MNTQRRHWIGTLPLVTALLLGAAMPASAAPAPAFSATIAVDSSCTFTVAAGWKNAKVASIDLFWYEAGYQNPYYPTIHDWIATLQYPQYGVLTKRAVVFTLGPAPTTDSVDHQWWANVTFRDAAGAAFTQFDTNVLSSPCYLPTPPPA